MSPEQKPTEAALAAAYQVTARWFASEQQLIWRRTSVFITLNALVVALLHFLPGLHASIRILLPLLGCVYSVCWHFSMSRAWAYHTFLVRLMREQEAALNLAELGAFSRGKPIADGAKGKSVGGELTEFPPQTLLFRAKVLADSTTWLFALVYLGFFIFGLSRL